MSVKELMTNLASSVRLKTGKTSKMTLEQIADAITGITVEGDIGFTSGTFKATASGAYRKIVHGLEQVPGAVILIKLHGSDSAPSTTTPSTSTYLYDLLMTVTFGKSAGYAYCYNYAKRSTSSSGSTSSSSSRMWKYLTSAPSSMFGTGNSAASYFLTNINESYFYTPKYLVSGRTYLWIAFRAPLL